MIFLLMGVGLLVALVVIALVLVPMLVDETALTNLATEAVRDRTGGELAIAGKTELSLFPNLSLELNQATLTIPPRDDNAQGVEATLNRLSLGLPVIPTLMGETEFSELDIDGIRARVTAPRSRPSVPVPTVELSDRGWEELGRRLRSEREAQRIRLQSGTVDSLAVVVAADALNITDITLELLDANGALENRLWLEELHVRNVNTQGQPVQFDTAAELQSGDSADPIRIALTGVIRVPDDLSVISLDRIDAVVYDALAQPIRADLNGDLTLSPLTLNAGFDAALPGGDVEGTLTYASLGSPAIDVSLTSDSLDLDRLQAPSSREAGAPVGATNTPSGQSSAPPALPPVPLPVGPLKTLDLALVIEAGELVTAGQRITDASLSLRVLDGIANLKKVQGTLHEGQLQASATLNARRNDAELALAGGLNAVNLNALMTSLGNPGLISGGGDITWDINSRGASAEALRVALSGDLDVSGSKVVVETVSLQSLMCEAIAQIRRKPLTEAMPETTALSELALAVDLGDGQAKISSLTLGTQGLTMTGAGAVALADLNFGLVIDTRVDNSLAELDPNCEVNERYAAIAWPITCEGNLTGEPAQWCGLDTGRIAEQLLRDEARDKLEEKGKKLLKKLLGD